jgi:hypothetical protein
MNDKRYIVNRDDKIQEVKNYKIHDANNLHQVSETVLLSEAPEKRFKQ